MPVNIIGTLKPKNNGKFPVAEAVDIKVTDNLRLDEALENKADLSAVTFALDNKANKTTTTDLQAQIDQIVISASAEAVVAPEVAQARVSEDGTEYSSLKARLDAQDEYTQKSLDILNANSIEVDAAFGFHNTLSVKYTSREVPQPDGTFFEDTGATQHWFGSGFVDIPEGAKRIRYRGKSFSSGQTTITPIAIYDENYTILSYGPATTYATIEGSIDIPNSAKYFYQTQYYESVDTSKNSNNYTELYFGEKYNMDYISQSAITTGVGATIYTASDYTSDAIYLADGTSRTFDNWYSTDFIECANRETVTYDSYAYHDANTNVAYVAFFDGSKTMISCLKSTETTNGEKIGTTTVPSGAKYVRSVTAGGITPKLQLDATGIYADYNFDDIAESKEAIGSDSILYEEEDYTDSAIYLTNGTSRTFADWYSTDFIDCSNTTSIDYVSYAFNMSGIDVAYVAFFDETKTMISCLKSSDTSQGEKRGTIDVPTGAK